MLLHLFVGASYWLADLNDVLESVCQNMSPLTSSKPRKSASSSGNMKRQPNARNCSSMLDFHRINSRGKDIHRCVQDQIHLRMDHKTRWLEALAIIMVSHEDLQVGLVDIPRVETPRQDTTIQTVAKAAEVMAVVHIPHKDEVRHMVQVTCLGLVQGGVEVVIMELVAQISLMVANMGLLVLAVAQT